MQEFFRQMKDLFPSFRLTSDGLRLTLMEGNQAKEVA